MALRGAQILVASALLALFFVAKVEARVILQNSPDNFTCEDVPANFGPRIPKEGVTGLLVVADPEDACSSIVNAPSEDWIALIVRSRHETGEAPDDCTFDMKVKRAQGAGALAAIVYDDEPGWPFPMDMPASHLPGPDIPAVLITQMSGFKLKAHCIDRDCIVIVDPVIDYEDTVWMSLLLTAVSGLMAIGLVIVVFYCVRRQRENGGTGGAGYSILRGDDGMSTEELRALPVVIHELPAKRRSELRSSAADKGELVGTGNSSEEEGSPKGRKGGGTLRTCAICIEDYREGEKLRVLPCKHRFHMECIDQWLSARKPLCPICKWNALEPFSPRAAARDEEAGVAPLAQPSSRPRTGFLSFRIPGNLPWRRGRNPLGNGEAERQGAGPRPAPAAEEEGGAATEQGGLREALLSATPENFPGMHAVRRNSERNLQASEGREGRAAAAPQAPPSEAYQPPPLPDDVERGGA